jgi:addiction module HigA family antidote
MLSNIHPGEILQEEFLEPLGISAYRLAKETMISQTRISEIVHGERSITADTALRLARFFGTTPQFWLGLQNDYDLEEKQKEIEPEIEMIDLYRAVQVSA